MAAPKATRPSPRTKTEAAPTRGTPGGKLGETAARAMILQGGARVFARRGVRLASVADILTLAKVSRRTFYRFYESKEDVLVALYRVGTEALLQHCRLAVHEESAPLRQIERVIDAHLLNARGIGHLVFVLGGEAQRQESALHVRRMEVHGELVELLNKAHEPRRLDPLMMRALVLALEGIVRHMLMQGDEGRDVSDEGIARAKRVMMRLAASAYAEDGADLPAMPTV